MIVLQVRQLAAILIRSRVARFWTRFPDAVQRELREAMLEAIMREPRYFLSCFTLKLTHVSSRVRSCEAAAISMIARYSIQTQSWPDLTSRLGGALQSPEVIHREVHSLPYLLRMLLRVLNTFVLL